MAFQSLAKLGFLASLSIVACVLTPANFRVHSSGIQEKTKLSIRSARPLAEAITALERNCGCAITYEGSAAEQDAHSVSDPIAPQYAYQMCQ
jgi:hypothetical protein